ncbi:MAG: substrate-binding domain-containing protein [Rhodospirillaceae bacterium]|nr:substrate-binding domain-containing protein [Rhodospirillaceae bacterium]
MTTKKPSTGISRRSALKGIGAAGLVGAVGFPLMINPAFAASSLKGKTIGFSMTHATNDWLVQMRSGVVNSCEAKGAKSIVLDANDKPSKQITDLETLAVQKVDAVIISTFHSEAIAAGVRAVNEAGIPVIVLSSSLAGNVDWTTHMATDTAGTARAAGEFFVKKLGGKGKVVQIEGKPGSKVNQARGKGWRDVMEATPGIEIVGHAIAHYQKSEALRHMEDILQRERQIDAVYCHNDGMAMGVIQAAKEAGRLNEMFITGYDGMRDDAMEAIYKGEMLATWEYLPFGVEAVDAAERILAGQSVPKEIQFPSPLISKDNILDYYDPATGKRKTAPSALSSVL